MEKYNFLLRTLCKNYIFENKISKTNFYTNKKLN